MSHASFLSGLGDHMGEFLDFKRKMGHPYERGICYLKDFDRFCILHFKNATCLDEKICLAWARRRPTETNSGFISRITPLRQLGKFLNSIGIQAYVLPESIHGHVSRYLPHIFTEQELKCFFSSVDRLVPYYQSVARHLVAPVLFRLIYCCGLRPYEGRLLQHSDVDLRTGRALIRQSKGHKDRIVIIPPDLLETCRTYQIKISCLFPASKVFFPNHSGNAYSAAQLRYLFELCWSRAGIDVHESPKPRVYDFRHTYCTYRLYQWMEDGRDITAWLPYLSAFLGHADYASTAYYIHLVPGALQKMSGFDLNKLGRLIPEVPFT